ncbi:uncharacterized protein METZ01_LOCUS278056 [marine metagenome]|uniref:Uncharacterized protein n=1 Tax=marine metagenome TaxID=408172 RepID=A0A382KPN1_9ZZZZ
MHQNLEPGAAVEIITETGLDPLNPVVPRSLTVVYVAIVDTTVAQRAVDARTKFVFALNTQSYLQPFASDRNNVPKHCYCRS